MTERELFIQLCIANTESANFDVLQAAAAKILEQADKRYPEVDAPAGWVPYVMNEDVQHG